MKQHKKDFLIVFLVLALLWSLFLNWLQSKQVDRLMEEVKNMEYLQTVLTSHIDELEGNGEYPDGIR